MIRCPECGAVVSPYRNPALTVDIIISHRFHPADEASIVFVERKNEPYGFALPGGFVDYGEQVEDAATREAKEETDLDIVDLKLFGVYSDPLRDPRGHTVSIVFTANAFGDLAAGDDAKSVHRNKISDLPEILAFDHKKIIKDYINR